MPETLHCEYTAMHLNPSEIHARIRAGGHFFLGSHNFNNTSKYNGAILTLSKIMKILMS